MGDCVLIHSCYVSFVISLDGNNKLILNWEFRWILCFSGDGWNGVTDWVECDVIFKLSLSTSLFPINYNGVIMSAMASQITSLAIVYSTVYSGADQRKHQSSASPAFVRWPVNYPQKGPVTRKMFPFDDVMYAYVCAPTAFRRSLYKAGAIGVAFVGMWINQWALQSIYSFSQMSMSLAILIIYHIEEIFSETCPAVHIF